MMQAIIIQTTISKTNKSSKTGHIETNSFLHVESRSKIYLIAANVDGLLLCWNLTASIAANRMLAAVLSVFSQVMLNSRKCVNAMLVPMKVKVKLELPDGIFLCSNVVGFKND